MEVVIVLDDNETRIGDVHPINLNDAMNAVVDGALKLRKALTQNDSE